MSRSRFGFVEYDSSSSAADAVSSMDGTRFGTERIQVKHYHYTPSYGVRTRDHRGVGNSRRTQYRVIVLGLSDRATWRDLKDFGRQVGIVNYADVTRTPDGTHKGILEFQDHDAMGAAIEKLSGEEILGQPVRVVPETANGSSPRRPYKSGSRYSRSPHALHRSRSPHVLRRSRSPHHLLHRSRSPPGIVRSRSPRMMRSRSPRGMRSRSPPPHAMRSRSPPPMRDDRPYRSNHRRDSPRYRKEPTDYSSVSHNASAATFPSGRDSCRRHSSRSPYYASRHRFYDSPRRDPRRPPPSPRMHRY